MILKSKILSELAFSIETAIQARSSYYCFEGAGSKLSIKQALQIKAPLKDRLSYCCFKVVDQNYLVDWHSKIKLLLKVDRAFVVLGSRDTVNECN